jgi:hypothetical protein
MHTPGHTLPGHTLPGHTLPGHTLPGHTLPCWLINQPQARGVFDPEERARLVEAAAEIPATGEHGNGRPRTLVRTHA